jgi:hypothetical protein
MSTVRKVAVVRTRSSLEGALASIKRSLAETGDVYLGKNANPPMMAPASTRMAFL